MNRTMIAWGAAFFQISLCSIGHAEDTGRFSRPVVAATQVAASSAVSARTTQTRGRVILLRGLFNVFSLGMDSLALKLDAAGYDTLVANHTQWKAIAEQIAADRAAGKPQPPLILIGHSLGGDDIIELAAELNKSSIPVDMLIPVDPVGPPDVPPNVRRAINYFQSGNGWGKAIHAGPGFQGSLINANLDGNRSDLKVGEVDHRTIDKDQRVQGAIIKDILGQTGGRPAKPKRTARS